MENMYSFFKENFEEWFVGFICGVGFYFLIGFWAILLGVITGICWRLGGAGWLGTKALRRVGVPSAILLSNGLFGVSQWIAFALNILLLSVGYGTKSGYKDINGNWIETDPGSPFGNWCVKVTGSELCGKWLARAIIVCGVWGIWYGARLF